MATRTSFTYKLTPDQQAVLTDILRTGNYRPVRMEHTLIAADAEKCRIALYKSGKCLVQGKLAEDFVTFVLEPMVLQAAGLGYEDVLDPDAARPHMGVDESGKGDFFGPLVVVAAYVDERLVEAMREMDVRDSKRITSDDKAMGMGGELRRLLGNRFSVVRIGPRAYNRLYAKMRNLNRLLAWAHARAIEDLLDVVPDCPRAISDQFGRKDQVEKALMHRGRKIELIQQPRAESDIAVAAASVIARDLFLRSLKKMEQDYDCRCPKGASAQVREAAVDLVKKREPAVLLDTVKCHFKTTDEVLKAAGSDRAVLGPEGAAVSKAKYTGTRKR
jgi:ribonuclease HIII